MKMKEYSIEEQDKIGAWIAKLLEMKHDRQHKTRWSTLWGSKTNIGIFFGIGFL